MKPHNPIPQCFQNLRSWDRGKRLAVPKTVPEFNRLRGFQLDDVLRGLTESAEIELFTD